MPYTADAAGALAVLVPKDRSCPVTETVVRVACGAAAEVPVVLATTPAKPSAVAERQRCKAAQEKAKAQLKEIFMAQKSWMAEHDYFTTLEAIMAEHKAGSPYTVCNGPDDCFSCEHPEAAAKRKAAAQERVKKSEALNALSAAMGTGGSGVSTEATADKPSPDLCNGITPTQQACKVPAGYTGKGTAVKDLRFTSCATANLDGDATLDVWSMNDRNELVNEVDDCAD